MATKGMDVEQVRTFGNQLHGQYSDQLSALKAQIQTAINNLNWLGADADMFKGEHNDQLGAAFEQLRSRLADLGTIALTNANSQDEASAS